MEGLMTLGPWPELRAAVASPTGESLRETATKLTTARATLHGLNGGNGKKLEESLAQHVFEDSIRLKNWLDWLEGEDAEYEVAVNSTAALALQAESVRCEYLLWKLNSATTLRYNPFLSHWIEFCQRWARRSIEKHNSTLKKKCLELRMAVATWILTGQEISTIENLVMPDSSSALIQEAPKLETVDLRPLIRMLQDEGIYDPPSVTAAEDLTNSRESGYQNEVREIHLAHEKNSTKLLEARPTAALPSTSKPPYDIPGLSSNNEKQPIRTEQIPRDDVPSWPEHIPVSQVLVETPSAVHDLIHLPANLSSLELINNLIHAQAFTNAGIETAEFIRQFIQHKLRVLEWGSDNAFSATTNSRILPVAAGNEEHSEQRHGDSRSDIAPPRDEQHRIVTLLILFMRNLIAKGLIGPEEIFFEIQEICTRYIWMREVRDFQFFIEGGHGGEGVDFDPGHGTALPLGG